MKPKLRSLEIVSVEQNGEEYFLLNDRLGIAFTATIPQELGGLMGLLDGERTPEQIVTEYAHRYGQQLPLEFVTDFVEQLDAALYLDSPHFQERKQQIVDEFKALEVRPSLFTNGAQQPEEAESLKKELDGFFEEARKIAVPPLPPRSKVRGIVVPHIDFQRGGVTEALAYLQLLDEEFDTFVVLGIAHCGVAYPFCATMKDFETPAGLVRCDREILSRLHRRLGDKLFAEEYAHKNEHSVEFVATFLKHLEGFENTKFENTKIVPVICGGLFEELRTKLSPSYTPEVKQFMRALQEVVSAQEAQGKRIGFIVSVDLSHVGTRFGDETLLTPERLREIEKGDREFLKCIEAGDAEAAHQALAKDNNARNVDAHPAIYTLLRAFPELRAQLLDYRQAHNSEENMVVSFAAMTLFSEQAGE